MSAMLSVFLQPQSTDFTQYNSYSDMCGGGRGESCHQTNLFPISPELLSTSIEKWLACMCITGHTIWNICLMIHKGVIRDSTVVDSSLAGDLTAKPLTVSLIFCPILSCRVSGMSLIGFFHLACSSPCIIYLLALGFQESPCPECTSPTPAQSLHRCWISVDD